MSGYWGRCVVAHCPHCDRRVEHYSDDRRCPLCGTATVEEAPTAAEAAGEERDMAEHRVEAKVVLPAVHAADGRHRWCSLCGEELPGEIGLHEPGDCAQAVRALRARVPGISTPAGNGSRAVLERILEALTPKKEINQQDSSALIDDLSQRVVAGMSIAKEAMGITTREPDPSRPPPERIES